MPTIPTGTIISGTLRVEDLAPAFLWTAMRDTYWGATDADAALEARVEALDPDDEDLLADLLDRIQAALDEGLYVGAHPGDAADFGVWEIDELL